MPIAPRGDFFVLSSLVISSNKGQDVIRIIKQRAFKGR